ncbi:hypothetical protein GGX14DRAFT_556900 [Mycena pura]|uniref:Uncharacterized protein n=1 Tax=Mycena pura TaxID=153505 RepID=A0AAD6YQL0_9AGAR|nr:hypothetical protein GGX14DRAFT_556900 [Mycena pura]
MRLCIVFSIVFNIGTVYDFAANIRNFYEPRNPCIKAEFECAILPTKHTKSTRSNVSGTAHTLTYRSSIMIIRLGYPNYCYGADYVHAYNEHFDAIPDPPVPILFTQNPLPTSAVTHNTALTTTTPTTAASRTPTNVVPIFDVDSGWAAMDSVSGDALTRALLRLHLSSSLGHHIASQSDAVLSTVHTPHQYSLRPGLMHTIASAFTSIADFVICAANDCNPHLPGAVVPLGMDEDSLEEAAISAPGIILFRGYSIAHLFHRRFASIELAMEFVHCARLVHNYYVLWVANRIRAFLRYGYDSQWNWGAPLGMAKTEFLSRNLPYFHFDSHRALERLMAHRVLRNAVDFACADLIAARSDNRLIYMNRGGFAIVTLWPLFDPVADDADLFTRHHMWELNITMEMLDNFMIDNTPGPLPDLVDDDLYSLPDPMGSDLVDDSSDELPELTDPDDSDDEELDDESDDGIF